MKKQLSRAIILLTLVLFGCGEDYCADECTLDKIIFFNLSPDELEYLEIRGYKRGSDFSDLKESSLRVTEWIEYDTPHWQFDGKLNKELDPDLDYEFRFADYDKVCRISEINVSIKKCGYGLFDYSRSKSFNGYLVNGEFFACQILKVFPKEIE